MKRLLPLVLAGAAIVPIASASGAEGDIPPRGQMDVQGPMERHEPGPGAGRGPWAGHGGLPMLRGVTLTEAQEDKLFGLLHAQEPQRREQERAARKASDALRAMADSGQFDDAKASALAQSEGRAVATLALQRARTGAKILALLTPEQREQAQQDGPQRGPRRGPQHGPQRGPRE